MPLAFLCPGSIQPDGLRVDQHNDAAATGSAAHNLAADLPWLGDVDWDAVDAVCARYPGADTSEVRTLAGLAVRLWERVAPSFPNAMTEVAFQLGFQSEAYELSGHLDLVSIAGDEARVADWKFGRKDRDYREQMLAYLSLVLTRYPGLARGTATILWARDQELEQYSLDQAGAREWVSRLEREVVRWNGVFHPGGHCLHCPHNVSCSGANAIERAAVAAMRGLNLDDVTATVAVMPANEAIALYRQAKMVESAAKAVRDAIRARASESEISDGITRIYLAETTRRHLDLVKAWPVLESAGFGDNDFARCAKLSLADAEDLVAKRAGKGSGARAKRDLSARLDAAGAIERETIKRLEDRRA